MSSRRTVAAGALEATLAPELGGRIIGLTFEGVELMWTDLDGRGGPSAPFPLPGGDKIWLAPQDRWPDDCPHPALDLEPWEWDGDWMVSPFEADIGARIARRVTSDADGLVVEARFDRAPTRPAGLWQVTQLRLPGRARLASADMRPAGEANDAAAAPWVVGDITHVTTQGNGPWKLSSHEGCRFTEAEVAGVRLRREALDEPAAGEVYDSLALGYWELEMHAPIGALTHTERWTAQRAES